VINFPTVILSISLAILVAVITHYLIWWREKELRKIEYIERQLKELYGPILALLTQNNKAYDRTEEVMAITNEKMKKEGGAIPRQDGEAIIKTETKRATDVIWANNYEIEKILKKNLFLLEEDDFGPVQDFFGDVQIRRAEFTEAGKRSYPEFLEGSLKLFAGFRRSFLSGFQQKFKAKQELLREHHNIK